MRTLLTLTLLALPAFAAAETLAPGGKVEKALTANVTPDGLDFMLDQGLALIPAQVDVPPMNGSQSLGICTLNYSLYEGQAANGINVNITNAVVTPQDGYLQLAISGVLSGTGTDDPPGGTGPQSNTMARVEYSGCGTSCNNGDYSVLRLLPMNFAVSTRLDIVLTIDQVTGEPVIDVTTPLNRNNISIDTNQLDAAGCSGIDFLVAAAKNFIGDPIKDEIIKLVNEDLIPSIEQGFQSVRYDDVLDVAGTQLQVKIVPSALSIRGPANAGGAQGISVSMSSIMDAVTPTSCVPLEEPLGSEFTPGDPPRFDATSPGGFAYDAAATLSDDLVNQALFAAWHGGLLCQTLDSMGGEPMTTELLALAGLTGPLKDLGVEGATPMLVVIKAYKTPVASYGTDPLVNVHVERLEISIFTEIMERTARLVALDLTADAGANLAVDPNNQLAISLAIDPANVVGTIAYGEPLGDDAEGLLGLLPVLIEQVAPALGGALPAIDLGNLAGVSLVNPEFVPQQGQGGVPNDTLGIYTGLAAAPGGCAAGGTGCGVQTGGCAVTGGASPANAFGFFLLGLTPFLATVLRRRS